jgi:hypothetical protein
MIRTVTSVILAIVLLGLPATVGSWQVLTHYQLGVEAGVDPERSYQMLPDSWPSHEPWYGWFQVTDWFAWSHAVLLTGTTQTVPNVPDIDVTRSDPGKDMYEIYKNEPTHPKEMYDTALGFLTHNAQDKAVHYEFFRGGSVAAWKEEHQYKELWSDCWIFQNKIGKFDDKGRPQNLPKIKNIGDSKLIELAEVAFRKTGKSLDRYTKTYLPIESAAEISGRLQWGEKESLKYFSKFSERGCLDMNRWAVNYNWHQDKLEDAYKNALKATIQVKKKFPPLPPTKSSRPSPLKPQPENTGTPTKADPNRFD